MATVWPKTSLGQSLFYDSAIKVMLHKLQMFPDRAMQRGALQF